MDYARVILSLVAVLATIGALAFTARRFGVARPGLAGPRRRRLQVAETLFLDPRRRAVILRCDDREQFVILGPAGETVVESFLPQPDVDAREPAHAPSNFADALRRFTRKPQDVAVSDAA